MKTTTPDSSLQPALDALHAALGSAFFPPGAVPTRNRNDYSGLAPTDPLAVARPADTAGVAATLRICNEHGVAVVPPVARPSTQLGFIMTCAEMMLAALRDMSL